MLSTPFRRRAGRLLPSQSKGCARSTHDRVASAFQFAYAMARTRAEVRRTGSVGRRCGVAVRLWLTLCVALAVFMPLGGSGGTARAAVPHGKADVYTLPASLSGLSGEPGTTFTLSVVVEPSGVNVDAASVAASFDARFLAVDAGGIVPAGPL